MKRAPNKLFSFDEEGTAFEVTKKDYVAGIVKELDVQPFKSEHQDSTPKEVVEYIMDITASGMPMAVEVSDEYPNIVERVQSDMEASNKHKDTLKSDAEKEKADKKKKREEEKKAKEAEAAELAKRQEAFGEGVAKGAEVADGAFKDELLSLQEALPEGVTIEGDKAGFGIAVAEGTDESNISEALGTLYIKEQNSSFLAGQLQFFVGDLANQCIEMGVYKSGIAAGKHISEMLAEKFGRKLSGRNVESYGRMAARTPVKFRNPRVDPTAYLAVSDAKQPKKGKDEKLGDYNKRLKKFVADRNKVLTKLANGEVDSRKETLPLVQELLYDHGIKDRPDPDAGPVMTTGDWLKQFWHASFALDNLIGVHEKGKASYQFGEEVHHVEKSKLEELKAEAEDNLSNIFYTNKKAGTGPANIIKGTIEVEQDKVVGEKDGKAVTKKEKVDKPVYPDAFFAVAEEPKGE